MLKGFGIEIYRYLDWVINNDYHNHEMYEISIKYKPYNI